MYTIRLIKNNADIVEKNDKGRKYIYDEYASATHIKIIDGTKMFLFDPVINDFDSLKELEYYDLKLYSHIFINHYYIYTIDELIEAYSQITQAYSMLCQTSVYYKDFDNVVSIFELLETLFAIKENSIINPKINKQNIENIKEKNIKKSKSQKSKIKTKKDNNQKDKLRNQNDKIENEEEKIKQEEKVLEEYGKETDEGEYNV